MAHSRGARPSHCCAQLASTRRRSQGATRGRRAGQPSTSAIPENDTSQGAPPIPAAAAASARWPLCSASNLPSATMGGSSSVRPGDAGGAAAAAPAAAMPQASPAEGGSEGAQPDKGRHHTAGCLGAASAQGAKGTREKQLSATARRRPRQAAPEAHAHPVRAVLCCSLASLQASHACHGAAERPGAPAPARCRNCPAACGSERSPDAHQGALQSGGGRESGCATPSLWAPEAFPLGFGRGAVWQFSNPWTAAINACVQRAWSPASPPPFICHRRPAEPCSSTPNDRDLHAPPSRLQQLQAFSSC